ncbi:MAG TPA: carotenoid oxygenase family protein [Oscillatoriales cyanobacterium M4454_W2019_049]|nr:carotenoid oxygenase family protein [Oscillatoriales cyanobacterium M4454_W2019_049]
MKNRAWAKAIAHTGVEFAPTPLAPVSGRIPPGLRGSLYRNGPARLERGGRRVGHWFDGDGAMLGVHFRDNGATGVYRFVKTEGYLADEAAGTLTCGSYGTIDPNPQLSALFKPIRKLLKNPASVSALPLDDRLLALWDQGHPYVLDLETLETRGEDTLGQLDDGQAYAAHYKRDGRTGEIYSFGITYDLHPALNVYASDPTGQIRQQTAIDLHCLPLVHDFILAGPYLVFFISPVRLNPFPVLAYQKSFGDCLGWHPELGTQILVLDRYSLRVISRGETDPWFQWHFGNGYVDADGCIVADMVRYEDFATNEYLKEVGLLNIQTAAPGTLWQVRLDPQSATVREAVEVLPLGGEFPVVNLQEVGYYSRYTYLSTYRPGADVGRDLWGTIARFDSETGDATIADIGENCYATEPVRAPDVLDPDRGWILTVVFDGDRETSEVWIFDGDRLDDEPVCKLALPGIIPISYHGTWRMGHGSWCVSLSLNTPYNFE